MSARRLPLANGLGGSGALRIAALAVATFLGIFYLKLGYYTVFVLPAGAIVAVLLTRKPWARLPPIRSALVAVVAFGAAYTLTWAAAVRETEDVRELRWDVVESLEPGEPEVRLLVGGSHYLFSHSSELARHLRSGADETVTVALPLKRVLGCLQGVGPPRIEGWGLAPLGGYGSSGGDGPWEEPPWCP